MKRVNFWKTLFFTALAAAAFTGCSNDDSDGGASEPSITVDGKENAVGAVKFEGGSLTFSVTSSNDWTLALSDASASSWCSVATSGGRGTTSLTFNIAKWEGAQDDDDRSVTATLTTYGTIAGVSGVQIPARATITVRQNKTGSTVPTTNVAEIRTLLKAMNPTSTKTAVTSEIAAKTITGIVVSKFEGHNLGDDYYFAVQDVDGAANSGLILSYNKLPDLKYSAGTAVTASLSGAQVQTYGGVIQLIIDDAVTIESSMVTTPDPIVVTPDQLSNYESMLVKIENCMPATGTSGKAWNNSTNKGNANFVTTDGKSFVVRTGSKAAFKDELIPNKLGYLIGIAGKFNNDLQLSPRTADDLAGLNQDAPAPDYKEVTIDELADGAYKLTDATIVGVHQKGVMFAQQVSGTVYYVLGFNNEWTTQTANPYIESIGKLADVQGICEDRFGMYQFSTFEAMVGTASSLQLPTPATFDAAAIEEYTANPVYKYVKLTGVLHVTPVVDNGNTYNSYTIDVAGVSGKTITFAYGLDAMFSGLADGDVVDASAIALGYDSSNAKLNVMLTSITKNTSTAAITILTTPTVFEANGGEQDIAFTVANVGSNKVYAKVEGEGFSVPTGEVTSPVKVTAETNTGALRKATLTIYLADEENGTAVVQESIELSQKGAGVTQEYTQIRKIADLTEGEYLIGGYGTTSGTALHLYTSGFKSGSGYTQEYTYNETDGSLSIVDAESSYLAVNVQLEKVEGVDNAYKIKDLKVNQYITATKAGSGGLAFAATTDLYWILSDGPANSVKQDIVAHQVDTETITNAGLVISISAGSNVLRSWNLTGNDVHGLVFFKKNF